MARSRILSAIAMAFVAASAGGAVASAEMQPAQTDWQRCLTLSPDTGQSIIDPASFFELLVERYRGLSFYRDVASVTQVTQQTDGRSQRVHTRIGCEVADGRLTVDTPASKVRRAVGLDVKPAMSDAMAEASMQYKMWLAPHMALKFADEPERQFRPGIEEGFTATDAQAVTVDEKSMVHLELKSGDGRSTDSRATFDLYINIASMLVERIEGQQRLPDGANYETTLQITPLSAESATAPTGGDDEPGDDDPADDAASPPMTAPPGAAPRGNPPDLPPVSSPGTDDSTTAPPAAPPASAPADPPTDAPPGSAPPPGATPPPRTMGFGTGLGS